MTVSVLGLDNIAVAFAMGPLGLGWRRIGLLGVIFAIAEAGMGLLGATAGDFIEPSAITEAARVGALPTVAVALIGLTWITRRPADIVASPWTLLGMSLLLGLDNCIAGRLGDPALSSAALVAAGMLTGALAAAACAVGSTLFPLAPRSGALVSSLVLAGLAIAGITGIA
jgi:putative Mn2+ efflux pump MntP